VRDDDHAADLLEELRRHCAAGVAVMDTAPDMTSRELIRWSQLHEQRGRRFPLLAYAILGGALLAAWVGWRWRAGVVAASHAWLAGAMVAYAVAFLRVPFHLYWRTDASLLAQLPIEGGPLFDAALIRCLRAAEATTIAVVLGGAPLALADGGGALWLRHAGYAVALGAAAGLLLPAVTMAAAALVVQGGADQVLRTATALAGAPTRSPAGSGHAAGHAPGDAPADAAAQLADNAAARGTSPSAILGALPGFAATLIIVAALLVSSWLLGDPDAPAPIVLGAIAAVSVGAGFAARARSAVMSRILRDVSALDRQRLATLEIKPPTPIEAMIARLVGAAALLYEKDARLVRRRYPMAFALGAIVFVVLVIVGIVRPDDPTPWLTVAIGGAASYGIVLATRLHRAPIELARLSSTLPLSPRARARAKLAWLLGWWSTFTLAPAMFAALRQPDAASGLALAGAATIAIIVAGALPR
jgi:hypothetical protein